WDAVAEAVRLRAVAIVLMLCAVLALFVGNRQEVNFRDNTLAWHLGRAILDPLPQNALLFVLGDVQDESVLYQQIVEHHRRDVTFVIQGMLGFDWYRDELKERFPALRLPELGPVSLTRILEANDDNPAVFCAGIA